MSVPHEAIARRLAARFAPELGADLPAATAAAIADERGEETPFRSADPSLVIAYASFLVSLSSLAWSVYKDLLQKETTAADVALLKGMLMKRLDEEAAPRALPERVRVQIVEAAADEAIDESRRVERR